MPGQKSDAPSINEIGEALYAKLQPLLKALQLPKGSYVVISIDTGRYATGPNLAEAIASFDKQFGEVAAYGRPIE